MANGRGVARLLDAVDIASRAIGAVACVVGVIVMVLTLLEVVLRRGFHAPTVWSGDLITMLAALFFVGSASTALAYDQHIKVDIFAGMLRDRLRNILLFLLNIGMMAPIISIVAWSVGQRAWTSYLRGTVKSDSHWEPLIWPFQAAISALLVLFALQLVVQGLRHLAAAIAGRQVHTAYPLNIPHRDDSQ